MDFEGESCNGKFSEPTEENNLYRFRFMTVPREVNLVAAQYCMLMGKLSIEQKL